MLDLVETVDEVDDGGLACSRSPHEGNLLPGVRVDVDVEEHLLSAGISEIYILEVHVAFRIFQLHFSLVHFRLSVA